MGSQRSGHTVVAEAERPVPDGSAKEGAASSSSNREKSAVREDCMATPTAVDRTRAEESRWGRRVGVLGTAGVSARGRAAQPIGLAAVTKSQGDGHGSREGGRLGTARGGNEAGQRATPPSVQAQFPNLGFFFF